jgi:type I restriction enzyme, S subunit
LKKQILSYLSLGQICDVQSGGTPSRHINAYWENGNIPWVKISDIKGKHLFGTDEFITRQGLENSSAKIFPKGTILYTIFATLGETTILNIDAATNQAIAGINIHDQYKEIILTDYLYYYLLSIKDIMCKIGRGVAQNNLNLKILRNVQVPVPSIEEQKKIIDTLSLIEKIMLVKDKQLSRLSNLVKSRFLEMFGDIQHNPCKWDIEPLSAVCHKITDGEHGSVQRVSEGYVYLNAKNIRQDGNIDWENITHISFKDHAKIFKRCNPEPDDILLTTTGTVGNIAIVPKVGPFSIDRGITLLKINNDRLNNIYLANLLNSEYLQQCMKNNIHASAIGHLFLKQVKSLSVMLPPLHLQNQFADYVVHIDKSKYRGTISLHLLEDVSHML